MARKFKFCIHCRRTITESMIGRGEFVKTRFGMICRDCAAQLEEEPEPVESAPAPAAPPEKPAEPPPVEEKAAEPEKPAVTEPPTKPIEPLPPPKEPEPVLPPPPPPPPVKEPEPDPAPPAEPAAPAPKPSSSAASRKRTLRARSSHRPEPPATAAPPAEPPAPPVARNENLAPKLEEICQRLEIIHRSLLFEKSSSWNVLAVVAQFLAFGVLAMSLFNWTDNPLNILLVALFLQLLALTCFVKGK